MGPLSYLWSVVDRNVVMRPITADTDVSKERSSVIFRDKQQLFTSRHGRIFPPAVCRSIRRSDIRRRKVAVLTSGGGGGVCELAPGNREGEENKIIFIWREK